MTTPSNRLCYKYYYKNFNASTLPTRISYIIIAALQHLADLIMASLTQKSQAWEDQLRRNSVNKELKVYTSYKLIK